MRKAKPENTVRAETWEQLLANLELRENKTEKFNCQLCNVENLTQSETVRHLIEFHRVKEGRAWGFVAEGFATPE